MVKLDRGNYPVPVALLKSPLVRTVNSNRISPRRHLRKTASKCRRGVRQLGDYCRPGEAPPTAGTRGRGTEILNQHLPDRRYYHLISSRSPPVAVFF